MAEEKTTTRTPRVIKDAEPKSVGPDPTGQGEVLSVKHNPDAPAVRSTINVDDLRGYIAYRTAQIYKPRLGGNIGGSQAIMAQQVRNILVELEELAQWIERGRPGPSQSLSEVDKDFYRAAVARDLPVPEEIKRQL